MQRNESPNEEAIYEYATEAAKALNAIAELLKGLRVPVDRERGPVMVMRKAAGE